MRYVYICRAHDPEVDSSLTRHYKIEYKPNYLPSSWTDVSDQFEVDLTRTDTSEDGTPNRKVYIVPVDPAATNFNAPGRFRFRPLTADDNCKNAQQDGKDAVLCAGVDGNPLVKYQSSLAGSDGLGPCRDAGDPAGPSYYWYMFRVNMQLCQNMTAFEGNQVNASDLSAWLAEPFEVNADGQTDTEDFTDMVDAYVN